MQENRSSLRLSGKLIMLCLDGPSWTNKYPNPVCDWRYDSYNRVTNSEYIQGLSHMRYGMKSWT